ncbi:hypothetical protein KAFR_0A03300 [Kazachstania africana CBS 2517]|uniref:Uncharacterized protein n=1 Tax=Kazachstania africana (strain ATCC 22294 / BCRC 22015 / CBS 2517 / CECT 1963 / NBRC 1671 / NRRL Y-8276) TaxID=1071382 RepID=H2AN15_KAZAF|nr:hypothetical protein KAFR_0A03300 [Kazachstania africana CBS 2517]CCF55765.1 hypothetical protein KAFR_0A03300 [Kazachstania africana CBS 2517]
MSAVENTNKKSNDKIKSVTLNHLQNYSSVQKVMSIAQSFPVVIGFIQWAMESEINLVNRILDSKMTPALLKYMYARFITLFQKVDNLFEFLVLREGVDSIIKDFQNHNNRMGFWVFWFYIDYMANVFNTLLIEFVIKPFKSVSGNQSKDKITSSENLPNVKELTVTTRNISNDIQGKAMEKYEILFKPTTDKLNNEFFEPAMKTYHDNLNKSQNIPKALYTTGIDIGNLTLEKLNSMKNNNESITKTNQEN